jgi:uncharacterized spore protein YtfJ
MDENVDLTPDFDEIESSTDAIDVVELTMDRLLDVANIDASFAEPVDHGDTTIIPCAEVLAVIGLGVGYGYGQSPRQKQKENDSPPEGESVGGGGGGGGWGRSFSRPVAVVVSSPNGVRVEPVIDVTKIALAAFTAAGFMLAMLARMARRQPPNFNEPS